MLTCLPMKISGPIVRGNGLATRLFSLPTANLQLSQPHVLEPGVYAAKVSFGGREYQAAAYVSPLQPKMIEVHLFGFSGDLYGQELEVQVIEKTSPHVDGRSEEEMKLKVAADVKKVREYFS